MGNHTETLSKSKIIDSFQKHEFGKMIETLNATAILVNSDYGDYKASSRERENGSQLPERTRNQLRNFNFDGELIDDLIPAIVGIRTEGGYSSGVFIRPNVIVTAAHSLRNPKTGEVENMRLIANTNKTFFKVVSIYYMKVNTEDIAFIVTDVNTTSHLDIYNKGRDKGNGVFTLGLHSFVPRFTQGTKGATLFQNRKWLLGMDFDKDGKNDGSEHLLTDNDILPGDSGGVSISNSGEILGIVSMGRPNKGITSGGAYLEPQSKIIHQYKDFIQAMTVLGVEIK